MPPRQRVNRNRSHRNGSLLDGKSVTSVIRAATLRHNSHLFTRTQPYDQTTLLTGLGRFCWVNGSPGQIWAVGPRVKFNNCFWRALACNHGGTQDLWPVYKYQVDQYLEEVSNASAPHRHARLDLYMALHNQCGNLGTEQAKPGFSAKITPEMWQVVADLYDIELIVISQRPDTSTDASTQNLYQLFPRGQNNRRQIFLGFEPFNAVYQPIQAVTPTIAPWDFRLIYTDTVGPPINQNPYMQQQWTRRSIKAPPPIFPPPLPAAVAGKEVGRWLGPAAKLDRGVISCGVDESDAGIWDQEEGDGFDVFFN